MKISERGWAVICGLIVWIMLVGGSTLAGCGVPVTVDQDGTPVRASYGDVQASDMYGAPSSVNTRYFEVGGMPCIYAAISNGGGLSCDWHYFDKGKLVPK